MVMEGVEKIECVQVKVGDGKRRGCRGLKKGLQVLKLSYLSVHPDCSLIFKRVVLMINDQVVEVG